jgi:hypothetical protein
VNQEPSGEELTLSPERLADLIRGLEKREKAGVEALLTGFSCAAWPTARAMRQ